MGFVDHARNLRNQVRTFSYEPIIDLDQGRYFRDIAFRKEVLARTFNPKRQIGVDRDERVVAPPLGRVSIH